MEKTNSWPFNINAVGFIFGTGFIAVLGADTRCAALGLAICLMWATTQICEAVRDHG